MADRVLDDASAAVAAEAGAALGVSLANAQALPTAAARHSKLHDQETPARSSPLRTRTNDKDADTKG
eukprot:2013173-Prymnesium_polylepis.1